MHHLPPPLWISSTIADTVETFSVPNVHQGTPSRRPLKSQYGCVRHASRSFKAEFPLSFLNLPQNTPKLLPPFPPYYSSRQKKACLCHILMCTIEDRPSAKTPTCMWLLAPVWRKWMKRHQSHMIGIWWEWLGLSVSVFVPLLLLWTARKWRRRERNTIHLFSAHIHIAIVVWHYLQLQGGCFVCCQMFGIRRWEVGETLQEWLGK